MWSQVNLKRLRWIILAVSAILRKFWWLHVIFMGQSVFISYQSTLFTSSTRTAPVAYYTLHFLVATKAWNPLSRLHILSIPQSCTNRIPSSYLLYNRGDERSNDIDKKKVVFEISKLWDICNYDFPTIFMSLTTE